MRLDAIVRNPFREDRSHVMKRKPHLPLHPAWQPVFLALAFAIPCGTSLRAQGTTAEAKKTAAATAAAKKAKPAPDTPAPEVEEIDPNMTLRNPSGQEIEARLLSASGDTVRIARTGDGREFVVPIASFDSDTGERIRRWMDQTPGAVQYSFGVEAVRNLVDSNTFMSGGRDLKTAHWTYHVKVTNLTRNDLSGAQLEYRIVFDDEVIINLSSVSPGKGANQQDGQLFDLPDMAYNDEIEFETPPLALHTYEYVPARGEREFSRDSVKGLWIRIVKNGEILYEYQSHPGAMASLSWDNEEEVDVRITNRFREQFGSSEKGN